MDNLIRYHHSKSSPSLTTTPHVKKEFTFVSLSIEFVGCGQDLNTLPSVMEAAGFLCDLDGNHDSDEEREISTQSNHTCKYVASAKL